MLADPAEPGVLRVDTLLDGAGVGVGPRLERRAVRLAHPREQRLETLADDGVVVLAPGVARDVRVAPPESAVEYGRSVLYRVPVTMTDRADGMIWRTSRRTRAVRGSHVIVP